MQDALYAMAEATGAADAIGPAVNARLEHVNTITSLDPTRIAEEADRIRSLYMRLAQSEGARAEFAMAEGRLDGWHGDAKAALIGKIENVRSHLDRMATEVGVVFKVVAAFYSLAVNSRTGHVLLCREIEAAALRELNNQAKRDTKLKLALGREIITSVLEFDSKAAVRSTLSAFVSVTGELVGYAIDGDDAADVAANYLIAGTQTTESFTDALDTLHRDLRAQEGALAWDMLEADVYQPLHSDADITSPDFGYEDFASSGTTPGPRFGPSVEAERKRVIEEREAGDSEINRRLSGAE